MMREEQSAEMNKLIRRINRFNAIIFNGFVGGAYDKVLKYIEQGEQLIKRFQGDLPEEIKGLHTLWLFYRCVIYAYRGNLALSFKYANELIRIGQLYVRGEFHREHMH